MFRGHHRGWWPLFNLVYISLSYCLLPTAITCFNFIFGNLPAVGFFQKTLAGCHHSVLLGRFLY